MHFGKQLRFLAYAPWKKRYIDFVGLKHKLKAVRARLIAEGRVKVLPQKRAATPTPPPYKPVASPQSAPTPTLEHVPLKRGQDMELATIVEVVRPAPERPLQVATAAADATAPTQSVQVVLLTPEAEEELLSALWEERDRVGDFFKQESEAVLNEVLAIAREAKHRRENGQPLAPLKKRFLDALVICEELLDFGRVNLVGFTKIIKKIARHTDFKRRIEVLLEVQQAPFVTMTPSIEALREHIKSMYVEAFHDPATPKSADAKLLQEIEASVSAARSWKLNTVLAQVDEHLQKAKIVEHKKHVNPLPIAIALVLFIVLVFAPIFPATATPAQRCLAVLVFGTVLWVSECVPLFVTGIFLIVITPAAYVLCDSAGNPLSPVSATSEVFKRLFPSSIPLVLAGFSISQAFRKFEIDVWIASKVLGAKIVQTPRRFLFAVLLLCIFMSMWISNIAAPVLTLTLIMPVLRDLPEQSDYRRALLMATAFAGNIGGMTTHIASPQNAVTVALKYPIDFISFIGASLPIWPFLIICGYFLLVFFFKIDVNVLPSIEQPKERAKKEHLVALTGTNTSRSAVAAIVEARHSIDVYNVHGPAAVFENLRRSSLDVAASEQRSAVQASAAEARRKRMREGKRVLFRLQQLPWKRITTIAIVVISIVLWIASSWLSPLGNSIGLISFIPLSLFYGTGLLSKDDWEHLPWAIVMLLSGGNILGYAVESSGLLAIIANLLQKLPSNLFLLCLVTDLIMLLASTFISSTVASLVLLPLAAKVGAASGHPRVLVMSAVIMCSGSMALPFSCFPNINASSVENADGQTYLKAKDFLKVGGGFAVLTLIGACSITYGMSLALGF